MNTFLKILLIALLVVVAVKLLPVTLAIGCLLAGAAVLALVVGASAAVLLFGIVALLAAVLAPIWLPVLIIVGIVALCRRATAKS